MVHFDISNICAGCKNKILEGDIKHRCRKYNVYYCLKCCGEHFNASNDICECDSSDLGETDSDDSY